jgi:transcriptional regulator with XRE-family HTH domain
MRFGEAVKAARKKKGLSQAGLAGKLYVSQATVSAWEKGTKFPSRRLLGPLAEKLDLDLNELLRLPLAPEPTTAETLEASA